MWQISVYYSVYYRVVKSIQAEYACYLACLSKACLMWTAYSSTILTYITHCTQFTSLYLTYTIPRTLKLGGQ